MHARISFSAVTVAAALTLCATTAAAQATVNEASSGTFGVSGGLTAPTGDFGDFAKSGWHLQLSLAGRAPSFGGPTLRLDGLYTSVGGKDGANATNLWTVNGNIVFTLPGGGTTVRPYFLGGVGYYNLRPDVEGVEGKGGFGLNGGGGLEFDLGQGLQSFLEIRFHHVVNAFESTSLLGGTESRPAQFIPVSFGIRF